MTSTPEAIVMVLEALRRIARNDEDFERDSAHLVTARAALDAWDRRERLRDDYPFRSMLVNQDVPPEVAEKVAGAIDDYLLGPRAGTTETKEMDATPGSKERP